MKNSFTLIVTFALTFLIFGFNSTGNSSRVGPEIYGYQIGMSLDEAKSNAEQQGQVLNKVKDHLYNVCKANNEKDCFCTIEIDKSNALYSILFSSDKFEQYTKTEKGFQEFLSEFSQKNNIQFKKMKSTDFFDEYKAIDQSNKLDINFAIYKNGHFLGLIKRISE